MGWELRRGRYYYYAKSRQAGRVVSRYGGGDKTGILWEILDGERGKERTRRRAADGREREKDAAIDRVMGDVDEIAGLLTTAVLIAEVGAHTHKGQWRRCRGKAHGKERGG